METRPRKQDEDDLDAHPVTVQETRPGRLVFTEVDNCDGWIATDLAVDPEP